MDMRCIFAALRVQAAAETSQTLAAERASWQRDETALRAANATEEARLRELLTMAEAQVRGNKWHFVSPLALY